MRTKKFSSYDQIDRELEILKIEKEISLQKLQLEFYGVKENLQPLNIIRGFVGSGMPHFSGKYGQLIGLALPYITKWLFKKRGW